MSESKVKEAIRKEQGLPDPKDRDTHLDETLAKLHQVAVDAGLTHNEAVEMYFRAQLGTAYDAAGNMTTAVDQLEEYLLTALTTIRTEAQPRITHIIEKQKLFRLN